ncbi:MAG TPA: ChbG/HpnK family deacetylase [Candidatus Baltobacteraceae bacterium]|jgi:predicted glycoside hydrolase/deacetylase ChbG (UPF0249 family)
MARLIVNADDLGADPHVDLGILEGFRNGIVSSTTLLITFAPHWERSATTAQEAGLPMGLHLSLTHGFAVSERTRIPDLVDERGRFAISAAQLISMGFQNRAQHKRLYDQIKIELDAQIKSVLSKGFRLTHVDSHQHVHMNPNIYEIVEGVATENGIRAMRIVREPFFAFQFTYGLVDNLKRNNFLKAFLVQTLARRIKPRLRTNERFFGLMQSDTVDRSSFTKFLRSMARTDFVWEAGIHPGHPGQQPEFDLPPEVGRWFSSLTRRREFDVVTDPEVKDLIRKERIEIISYAAITQS